MLLDVEQIKQLKAREEYVREGGEWRIVRSRLERLRVDPLE
jgi:hypothetical protein